MDKHSKSRIKRLLRKPVALPKGGGSVILMGTNEMIWHSDGTVTQTLVNYWPGR